MSNYVFEELTKVVWAASIADPSNPTVAELEAAVDLSCFIVRDGLDTSTTTSGADDSSICTRQDTMIPGNVARDPAIKMKRDNNGDAAWNLVNWGDEGNLVVRRGIPVGTAWTAGQPVEVLVGAFGEPSPIPSAANTVQAFNVKVFNRPGSDLKATVAA